jgi:hypothetical protein
MISIVICSRSVAVLSQVEESVKDTIGLAYEIIAVDNSAGKYSIFEAYNIGIDKSKYDIICFMHEDISFKTANWGLIVRKLFEENKKLGLLGVAGSSYKTFIPSGWVAAYAEKAGYVNILQSFKDKRIDLHSYANPKKELLAKVISVDGVWFCARKSIATEMRFDEHTFKGFHCYDVDFSLSVGQQYDVAVTFEILINHFSEGSFDESWAAETIRLHEKWKHHLPLAAEQLSREDRAELEFKAFHGILPKIVTNRRLLISVLRDVTSLKMLSLLGAKRVAMLSAVVIKKIVAAF